MLDVEVDWERNAVFHGFGQIRHPLSQSTPRLRCRRKIGVRYLEAGIGAGIGDRREECQHDIIRLKDPHFHVDINTYLHVAHLDAIHTIIIEAVAMEWMPKTKLLRYGMIW